MTTGTIMVVEDNSITRKMVRVALEGAGYTVVTAADGATALAHAENSMPDLVLQDLVLPDMSGFALVERLRALPGGALTRILAFTGFVSRDEDARISAARFDGVLIKPVMLGKLLAAVEEGLRSRPRGLGAPGQRPRVLLVDDDPTGLLRYRVQLERYGYRVTTARDGREALAKARRRPPEVVLSDVLMPKMDGFRLAAAIRADRRLARIPVVLFTVHFVEDADRELARRVGAQAIVTRDAAFEATAQALSVALTAAVPTTRGAGARLALRRDYVSRIVAQLEHQAAANQETAQRAELQTAALGVLGAIGAALSRRADVAPALDEILARCIDAAGLSRGAVLLRGDDGSHRCAAQVGFSGDAAEVVGFFSADSELAGLASGGALVVLNAGESRGAAQELLVRAGASSALISPITSGADNLGLLFLTSATKLLTGSEWSGFAQAIASQLGQALALSRAFAQLTESETRYRSLFEEVPIGLMRTTAEGQILDANPAVVAKFGYPSRESLLHTPAQALYAETSDRERLAASLKRDGEVRGFEATMQRFDDTEMRVEMNVTTATDPRGRLVFEGSILDVTERHRAAAALRASERRLAAILDAALDAVITMDEAGLIQAWNPRAENTFGWTAEEALGRPLVDLIIPHGHREAHRRGLAHFLATGEGPVLNRRIEITALHRDGREFPVELAISPVRPDENWLFSAFVRDLSERKSLEAQLQQAQRLEAVGQLAGGVAHDFNNLLAVVTVFTELVSGEMAANDQRRDDLEQVQEAARRATALTRQLLAFSRQQVLRPVTLDPNSVITNLGKMLGRLIGEDIELITQLAPSIGLVLVDPGQLEQVIMNLALNARDAMPSGGRLTIATGQIQMSAAQARALGLPEAGDFASITVTDTGTGMAPEVLTKAFEPFFTTKEHKGTGLGLATVYGIVRQSGGHIGVSSALGEGTTFTIHLPRVAGEVDATAPAPPAAPARGSETILLAEDEPAVRQAATVVLKRYGYAVLAARNGAEALADAAQHEGPIHMLLTDVVMPGMDGRTLLERLRATRPELKALFMSGYAGDAVARRGVIESGEGYLQKPFSATTLAQKVREALDAPQARP